MPARGKEQLKRKHFLVFAIEVANRRQWMPEEAATKQKGPQHQPSDAGENESGDIAPLCPPCGRPFGKGAKTARLLALMKHQHALS